MAITFTEENITDPTVAFENGVAAIDGMTLVRAAEAVNGLGLDMSLPTMARVQLTPVFDDLCQVLVAPGPKVSATIDTQKMRWGYESNNDVWRDDFTDYAGVQRYGVHLKGCPVARIDSATVTRVPTKLTDGRRLLIWFAEVPMDVLASLGLYELFGLAESFSSQFDDSGPRTFDWVVVPAQQISYTRNMDELLSANPAVQGIEQKVFMALDETGVRVKAVTEVLCTGMPMPASQVLASSSEATIPWLCG